MIGYPQHIVISRRTATESSGTLDKRTGIWTKSVEDFDPDVVYDGAADIQDPGVLITRDQTGMPTMGVTDDVVCFLQDEKIINKVRPDDIVLVHWGDEDDSTDTFIVIRANRLDGTLLLRRGGEL